MEDVWSKVIDSLKDRVGQQNLDIWIKPIRFVSMEGEHVVLEVPNRFFKEWINEHYSSSMKEAFSTFTQKPCHLQFRIKNDKIQEKDAIPPTPPKNDQQDLPLFQTDIQSKIYLRSFCGWGK